MSIKAVLFDLDGTLLPMDQEHFVKSYLGLLGKRFFRGYITDRKHWNAGIFTNRLYDQ